MNTSKVKVSIEFFPPKDMGKFLDVAKKLSLLHPVFYSVTCGAFGTDQAGTVKTIAQLAQHCNVPIMPHLTCINATRESVKKLLTTYTDLKIKNLMALRGDLPSDVKNRGDFAHANELVKFVRQETGDYFDIKVAAYPEFHPEAKTSQADVENLKRKIDAGANCAITQFFYNTDAFFYFLEDCDRLGIDVPIVPGIMPIYNWKRLTDFAGMCGAELPLWLRKRVHDFGDDEQAIRDYGLEVVTEMCEKFMAAGITQLHFYALNQSDVVLQIGENLGLN
ncbi:MAG: methylenetetrahydrofolate reductase [NAD(P)H] [Pseudomonadota bacterium]